MLLCSGLTVKSGHAANTASGTAITTTATLTYTVGIGSPQTKNASVTVIVDNKLIPTVAKNGDAAVTLGATNQVLVFALRNDGNTPQRYLLSPVNSSGFAMNNVRIYLDNGSTPGSFDATDKKYDDASSFGDVAVGATLAILIVADTPSAAPGSNTSIYHLLATTVDAGGTTTPTAQTAGANTAGVDVVFADSTGSAAGDGNRDGKHSAFGTFTINGTLALAIVKSYAISADPKHGTTSPIALPGATVAYTLAVTVSGPGTTSNVVVTDPIPANATYKAASLKLNGAALSDASGDDAGGVGGSPMTVTVSLGNLTSASVVQTITFEVIIDEYKP